MIIRSFIKTDVGLRPVKVEVVLVPGVSQIQILGLADLVIKESSKRILSALRHQGFRLPPGRQVLVNLHPVDLRKKSQGLDLAIALGILMVSEQLQDLDFDFDSDYCYGNLTLTGEVICPHDLQLLNYEKFNKKVMTGENELSWNFATEEFKQLADVTARVQKASSKSLNNYQEPPLNGEMQFSANMARLMKVVAIGEHPMLIAGGAGSGKTTLIENLVGLLDTPDENDYLTAQKYWKLSGRDLSTRPVVQPHHSATPTSMVGGGRPLKIGEISLAHGGALVLDELLEFHPVIQNALREPMEKGVIHLSRAGVRQSFPAKALVLATTNLCPCGYFTPQRIESCQCSSQKLRRYIERLSGPFLDRFCIFHIISPQDFSNSQSLLEIKENIKEVLAFKREYQQEKRVNQYQEISQLKAQLESQLIKDFIPYTKSIRREQSLLRVARTLADMDFSKKIKAIHLEEAAHWTQKDIYKIETFRREHFIRS